MCFVIHIKKLKILVHKLFFAITTKRISLGGTQA